MIVGFYLGKNLENSAVRTDDEGGADESHVFPSVILFLPPGAVGLNDFFLRIA